LSDLSHRLEPSPNKISWNSVPQTVGCVPLVELTVSWEGHETSKIKLIQLQYSVTQNFLAMKDQALHCAGLKLLTAVIMRSSVWDITPCSPLKVNRCFGDICLPPASLWFLRLAYIQILKMEAICSSEMSVDLQRTARRRTSSISSMVLSTRVYVKRNILLHFYSNEIYHPEMLKL
jgi:hypothetical protein